MQRGKVSLTQHIHSLPQTEGGEQKQERALPAPTLPLTANYGTEDKDKVISFASSFGINHSAPGLHHRDWLLCCPRQHSPQSQTDLSLEPQISVGSWTSAFQQSWPQQLPTAQLSVSLLSTNPSGLAQASCFTSAHFPYFGSGQLNKRHLPHFQ